MCRVAETYVTDYIGEKIHIRVAGEWIELTRHHPVWVIEGKNLEERPRPNHVREAETAGATVPGRWVDAGDLQPGDVLLLKPDRRATVEAREVDLIAAKVYNFQVEGLHNYAVGFASVLVHNNAFCPNSPSPRINKLQPNPDATGPHTTFKSDPRTGQITGYETYTPQTNPQNPNPWQSQGRFDLQGKPHFNKATGQYVPTPHVHDPQVPGGVRPALPGEIPDAGI